MRLRLLINCIIKDKMSRTKSTALSLKEKKSSKNFVKVKKKNKIHFTFDKGIYFFAIFIFFILYTKVSSKAEKVEDDNSYKHFGII